MWLGRVWLGAAGFGVAKFAEEKLGAAGCRFGRGTSFTSAGDEGAIGNSRARTFVDFAFGGASGEPSMTTPHIPQKRLVARLRCPQTPQRTIPTSSLESSPPRSSAVRRWSPELLRSGS